MIKKALPQISRGQIPSGEEALFHKHVCPPQFGGPTPDAVTPTIEIERKLLVNFDLDLPSGQKVPMWIIEDPNDSTAGKSFPSKTIRVTKGDIVHARVSASTNTHTIHWHGIEPTPMNDGVGKHSFEISGNYTYQFQPNSAGTYLYHCHKNTTLHFEMGLYGLIIIDPKKPDNVEGPTAPYSNGGPGFVSAFDPPNNVISYDVEAFWVSDEIDTRWHTLGHDAAMQACDKNNPLAPENFTQDGILNDFRPDVFLITGVPRVDDDTPIEDSRVAVTAKVGQAILARILHAGYTIQRYTVGHDVEVIAIDGRALGVPPNQQYSSPFTVPANTPTTLTTARRADIILRPTAAGKIPVTVEFFHWITGHKLATARTVINVEN